MLKINREVLIKNQDLHIELNNIQYELLKNIYSKLIANDIDSTILNNLYAKTK